MKSGPDHRSPHLGVFHLSCWVLGIVAFLQMMSVGVALAMRPAESRVIERVVREYVPVNQPATVTAVAPPSTQLPEPSIEEPVVVVPDPVDVALPKVPERDPLAVMKVAPLIFDPKAERLVREAREARLRSDHVTALLKLGEADAKEPENAAILYEMGSNFEAMGIYDKATDQYLKLYGLGPVKGGSLWKKAATKLEKGVVPDTKYLASMGVIRLSPVQETLDGERHSVVVPISVSLSADFDPGQVQILVHFFEKQRGRIKQVEVPEATGFTWMSEPANWEDGEELVEIWYHIPPTDRQQRHLFGAREFHGYVAELYYGEELMDVRAHPRPLINQMRKRREAAEENYWDPDIPHYLDGESPIEDAMQDHDLGDPLIPQLPQR